MPTGDLRSHDLYELQRRLRAKYGNIVKMERAFGQQPWIFLMDPELIEKVSYNRLNYQPNESCFHVPPIPTFNIDLKYPNN